MKELNELYCFNEENGTEHIFYRNPFVKFGMTLKMCEKYYKEIFGHKNITDKIVIDSKINIWIKIIIDYNCEIINKYNKNSYISSLLLFQTELYKEYNFVREIRKNRILNPEISEILYSNTVHLETTTRMINVFIEESIKNGKFGEVDSYLENDEIFRLIIYTHIYYVLNNYRSRDYLSRTVIKSVLKIYPNDIIFYNLSCPYLTTTYNANGSIVPYDIDESLNEDIMNEITYEMYGLNYRDTLFGFCALSEINSSRELPVNTLRIDDIYNYLKWQFKDIDCKRFFEIICIHSQNIEVPKNQIYKRQHKCKLELAPLILLDNSNIILSKTLALRSMEYIYNIMKNGVQPYLNKGINNLVEKVVLNNSKQMVEDVISLISSKYKDSKIKRSVKASIFTDSKIDYGDYDILAYVPSKNQIFSIEVKYICTSFETSGIENDIKKICKKGGYGEKFKRRNQLLNNNIKKLKEILNISKEKIICVEPIFLSSKPIQFPFVSYEYEGFFMHYDLLIPFIEDKIEYYEDVPRFYRNYISSQQQ